MQGAAPRWYGRNIVSLDLGRGGAEQRELDCALKVGRFMIA